MGNRKNLRPKDVEKELEKNQSPRDVNPKSQSLTKRNPGEKRAEEEENQKRIGPEYPGIKE